MLDYIQLFDDYSVDYALEGKNVGQNFIGIHCPYCGDSSYHGGVPKDGKEVYNCWRCGTHNLYKTLEIIIGVPNITTVLSGYKTEEQYIGTQKIIVGTADTVKVPGENLQWYHKQYLEKRRYDPDFLIQKYKVKGTTPYDTEFKFRSKVIFPIIYKGETVSYQGRSIRDDATYRYITASPDAEKIFHKHILYNIDHCTENFVVLVEGVFDALRLGDNSCATFGTSFLPEQLLLLKPYTRVFLLYDDEFEAQEKAKKAAHMIETITAGDVYVTTIGEGKDPDDLTDDDAQYLMNEFRRVVY